MAQQVAREAHNLEVAGSNPAPAPIIDNAALAANAQETDQMSKKPATTTKAKTTAKKKVPEPAKVSATEGKPASDAEGAASADDKAAATSAAAPTSQDSSSEAKANGAGDAAGPSAGAAGAKKKQKEETVEAAANWTIRRNGKQFEEGDPLTLPKTEFDHLKSLGAVREADAE